MDRTPANDTWFQGQAARSIHEEQLKKVELFNGRAAMIGFVIGVITEGLQAREFSIRSASAPSLMAT